MIDVPIALRLFTNSLIIPPAIGFFRMLGEDGEGTRIG